EARWQSGYAAACKAADLGSIPGLASNFCADSMAGENAARPPESAPARMAKLIDAWDLKSLGTQYRAGSSPAPGTTPATQQVDISHRTTATCHTRHVNIQRIDSRVDG